MNATRSLLGARRLGVGIASALVIALLAGCSGGDDPAPGLDAAGAAAQAGDDVTSLDPAAPQGSPDFANDPALESYLLRDAVEVPGRFSEVERDDRQPILSLGRVAAAARSNYASGTTGEQLSVDVLRIEPDVEPGVFFAAFSEALVGDPNFRDLRRIGVVRGVGDSARRFAFTLEGDDAEAALLLRGDVVVLLLYRRPAAFRQPLDVSALLVTVDLLIQFDARAAPTGG